MIYLLPSRSLKLARSRLAGPDMSRIVSETRRECSDCRSQCNDNCWRVSGVARRARGRALTCQWCVNDACVARGEAPRRVADRLWNGIDWWRQLSDAIATRGEP